MSLTAEIERARQSVKTQSYSMSIGELINLYKDKELDVHPEFQRFFRWTDSQKTRLIESILLGIPIPPIFVSQRKDGKWDVIDGLQRLSTIFEVNGILLDENGKLLDPLELQKAKYLPSLAGKKWINTMNPSNELSNSEKLIIRRSKVDVNIILDESSESTKYELFQRLNTGGSPLTRQEVRNCILVMEDKSVFRKLREIADYPNFKESINIPEKSTEEQYDLELLVRFLIFRNLNSDELKSVYDIHDYIDERTIDIAKKQFLNLEYEEKIFKKTFDLINKFQGQDSFKRYDTNEQKFKGAFLVSAFECIAIGVSKNIDTIIEKNIELDAKIKKMWSISSFTDNVKSGVRGTTRLKNVIEFGMDYFSK